MKRGDKIEEYKDVTLAGTQNTFENGFLGVLLMRDDPEPGTEIGSSTRTRWPPRPG